MTHDILVRADAGASLRERPRRLRRTPALRDLLAETRVRAEQLIMPHFVLPFDHGEEPIASMPTRAPRAIRTAPCRGRCAR